MSLQLLFDALALGGIYAIAALGIALIFGVMRLVNFAHGQFIACAVFALILPSTDALAVLGLGVLPGPILIPLMLAFARRACRCGRGAGVPTDAQRLASGADGGQLRPGRGAAEPAAGSLWRASQGGEPLGRTGPAGANRQRVGAPVAADRHHGGRGDPCRPRGDAAQDPDRAGDARGGRGFHYGADAGRAVEPRDFDGLRPCRVRWLPWWRWCWSRRLASPMCAWAGRSC
jgi:hypothetical protein